MTCTSCNSTAIAGVIPHMSNIVPNAENACKSYSVTGITKVGDEYIITLSDCTYIKADASKVSVTGLLGMDSAVTETIVYKNETTKETVLKVVTTNFNTGRSIVAEYPLAVTGMGKVPDDSKGVKNVEFNQNVLTIELVGGTVYSKDLSSLITPDKFVNSGQIVEGTKLKLLFENSDSYVLIDLAGLIGTSAVSITKMTLEDSFLVMSLSNGSILKVSLEDLINKIKQEINNLANKIKNQAGSYALTDEDWEGNVIIRMTDNGNARVTVNKPSDESMIGRAVIIRKAGNLQNTVVTLENGTGVTLLPNDAKILRREGSSVTLVYLGNGLIDIYGELF